MSKRGWASQHPVVRVVHNRTTGRIILALAVVLGVSSWYVSRQALNRTVEQRFVFKTNEAATAITERMSIYQQLLWSGVGLFDASDTVTRQSWHEFVGALNIQEQWPGIQGMGYAVPLRPDEVDGHEATIRAEGFPNYIVRPAVRNRSEYSAIVYLEPFDWRNQRAFGFDMWSNDVRRDAMTRARDSGQAATTGMITLVQETDQDIQKGFLTYVPVYRRGSNPTTVEDRRDAFMGWVYAPFRMGDLMEGILGSDGDQIDFQIYDSSRSEAGSLLYDSNDTRSPVRSRSDQYHRRIAMETGGHTWHISFSAGPELAQDLHRSQPTVIALAGVLIDIVLFYVITALGALEHRATVIATAMNAELSEAKDELEERSQQLERHARELERSNSELAQFAYAASHDLQEPLRTVGNYSQLIATRYADQLDEDGQRWLDYMASGARQMSDLIRSLLDYSRVDGDAEPWTVVPLDASLDAALAGLAGRLSETDVVLERSPLPSVMADPAQMTRLFQNLIGNALKYRSRTEPARVAILCQEDTDHWLITVADNGTGIKAEYHDRIFELFRRADTSADHPGSGVGLAMCRRIVERHQGQIGVRSAPDQGSEFWFTLPRIVSPPAGDDDGVPAATTPTTQPTTPHPQEASRS